MSRAVEVGVGDFERFLLHGLLQALPLELEPIALLRHARLAVPIRSVRGPRPTTGARFVIPLVFEIG